MIHKFWQSSLMVVMSVLGLQPPNEDAGFSHRLFPASMSRRHRPDMDLHGKQDTGRTAIGLLHTHFRGFPKHSLASVQPNEPGVAPPRPEWRRCEHPNPRQAWHYRRVHKGGRLTCFEDLKRRTFKAIITEARRVFWPQSIHISISVPPRGGALYSTRLPISSETALSRLLGGSD